MPNSLHNPATPTATDAAEDADGLFDEPFETIDPDHNLITHIQSKSKYHTLSSLGSLLHEHVDCFSMIHCNVRSAQSNMDALTIVLSELEHDFTIVGISETWLSEQNIDLYSMPRYNAFHSCRRNRRGGGVALYVKNHVSASRRPEFCLNVDHLESVFVELKNVNHQSSHENPTTRFILGVVYRPPNTCVAEFLNSMQEILQVILSERKTAFIMGDFNIHMDNCDSDPLAQSFMDLMNSAMFLPLIDKPTRVTTKTAHTIDNIFSNKLATNLINGILHCDATDHYPIFTLIPSLTASHNNTQRTRIFSERNRRLFTAQLEEVNWTVTLASTLVSDATESFLEEFKTKYDECFPLMPQSSQMITSKRKPWVSRELRILLRKKNAAFTKFRKNPTLFNEIRYRSLKIQARRSLRSAEREYYHSLIEDNKLNMRRTWQIIREVIGCPSRSSIPTQMQHDEQVFSGNDEIAEAFGDFFGRIGRDISTAIEASPVHPNQFLQGNYPDYLSFNLATEAEISAILSSMRNSCAGHDAIRPLIVKENADSLVPPITHIINLSMIQGSVPDQFKIAQITPVHKAGNTDLINNYRPISVLTVLSKVLEKVVCKRLVSFFDAHSVLSNSQFGFRRKHSCELPLILATEFIRKALDDGDHVIAVFLDLRKAFDVVSHQILLGKLAHYGIRGTTLQWMTSYLNTRVQSVKISGSTSSQKIVTHGVPQGSVLGPLLFLAYVNDLKVHNPDFAKILLYADDTTILVRHSDLDRLVDLVNTELQFLSQWFISNRLSVNLDKTQLYVHYPTQPSKKPGSQHLHE